MKAIGRAEGTRDKRSRYKIIAGLCQHESGKIPRDSPYFHTALKIFQRDLDSIEELIDHNTKTMKEKEKARVDAEQLSRQSRASGTSFARHVLQHTHRPHGSAQYTGSS